MSQTVALKVGMSCQGCAGAVRRVLGKMEGVESYDIDMQQQKVTVIGNVEPEAVFQMVSKTGKKTAFWEEPASASAETEPKPKEEAAAVAATPADQAGSNPTEAELKPTEAAESKPSEAAESKPAEAAPPAA